MRYVTYDNLIQVGLFVIALIGLVYKISFNKKITAPWTDKRSSYFGFHQQG